MLLTVCVALCIVFVVCVALCCVNHTVDCVCCTVYCACVALCCCTVLCKLCCWLCVLHCVFVVCVAMCCVNHTVDCVCCTVYCICCLCCTVLCKSRCRLCVSAGWAMPRTASSSRWASLRKPHAGRLKRRWRKWRRPSLSSLLLLEVGRDCRVVSLVCGTSLLPCYTPVMMSWEEKQSMASSLV